MLIGGFQKFSLIDYPGKICAIVFTSGCNFRCKYCHNPELVDPQKFPTPVREEKILSFLEKRKGKLDAVEITGGEPTLQHDLLWFIARIKEMGFLVKVDTNGSNPDVLEKLIDSKVVDYVAMDIKAPMERYYEVTNCKFDINKIKRSLGLIMDSDIDYEFRTTVVGSQLLESDILKIAKLIKGARLYVLQRFIPTKTIDTQFATKKSWSKDEFDKVRNKAANYVHACIVR